MDIVFPVVPFNRPSTMFSPHSPLPTTAYVQASLYELPDIQQKLQQQIIV